MKKLTNAEEDVMQILWDIGKGFVKDVIDKMPDPKPPYNTVSTVIRILEKKDFISHTQYGNTYEYYPVVSREDYAKVHFNGFLSNYFNNSFPKMAAFFARENNLSMKELEEIIRLTEEELKKSNNTDYE
ncbi:MAG: BlaI/MecI/CopY family transcriptional regulator [Bacteroidales bacterium]|nr:BlaI/MecI/CopY family transcriptional regulator [Bacteroidales bacterium]